MEMVSDTFNPQWSPLYVTVHNHSQFWNINY